MKHFLLIILSSLLITSCGVSSTNKTPSDNSSANLNNTLIRSKEFMNSPIPQLISNGKVHKSLGSTNHGIHPIAEGELTTALVFVDFEGYPCQDDPEILAKQLTSGNRASEWFKNQSYGKMTMKFEIPVKAWRTMSKSPKSYDSKLTTTHAAYIEEALNLYPEVNFTNYNFVVIIPSNKSRMGVGTACFSTNGRYAAKTKHGKVNLGVTFATSQFNELTYYTLIHELGHALGLPDTYDYKIRDTSQRAVAGPWDLMCDVGNGTNFLGWHRHKLDWLTSERKHFVTENELTVTLHPLSQNNGLAMLVIPVEDGADLSKVFVVELALPIRSKGKELETSNFYGEGILVYSVDARIGSGYRPLVVYPKSTDYSPEYSFTYRAPFLVGETFAHKDAPFKLEVLSRNEQTYTLKITKLPVK